jgi:hypothetical protein
MDSLYQKVGTYYRILNENNHYHIYEFPSGVYVSGYGKAIPRYLSYPMSGGVDGKPCLRGYKYGDLVLQVGG